MKTMRLASLMAAMMMTMTMNAQLNDSISIDTTMWFNQTQELSGVVVKGRLPKTRVKGDAMRTKVAGTILEKAGTVSDALSKIPSLEAEREGGVKVLGRGDAEVYINGRRVQDMKELSRLRSDQIQHVDVVQNPGARYAASVKAVVRITLKKAQGEGLSFQNSTQFMYQYGGSLNDNFTANYRTGGLDVTGSFWVGTYNHWKSLQVNDMLYYVGPDLVTGHSTQEIRHPWHAWSPQLQLNYMVNDDHTFGAYYKYDRTPKSETKGDYLTDMFENGILTERSASYIWQDQSIKKHIFNAYYNGKVGQLSIDLNIDGLFDDTKTPGRTEEETAKASPSNTKQYDSLFDKVEFREIAILRQFRNKAVRQMGTSGKGNHFVDICEIDLPVGNALGVPEGCYLGILSHSGSRGLGAAIADYYTSLAKESCRLPRQAGPFAWLDLNSGIGEEYWRCMEIAGEYSAVNHRCIHYNVAKALRLKPLMNVSNHHNFAWKETLPDGREVIIHRKGATPAHLGEFGIIPGSMATPGYVVSGKGCRESLFSASHGAGRRMSRLEAKNSFSRYAMKKFLAEHDVTLLGGTTEEAPQAYKDIYQVMESQKELVNIEGKIIPRIVRMNEE